MSSFLTNQYLQSLRNNTNKKFVIRIKNIQYKLKLYNTNIKSQMNTYENYTVQMLNNSMFLRYAIYFLWESRSNNDFFCTLKIDMVLLIENRL